MDRDLSERRAAAGVQPQKGGQAEGAVPDYLEQHYWWAYVRPGAVRLWERQWLINLVLLGNYRRLGAAVLEALGAFPAGRCLQIACCYGGLTVDLARRVASSGGSLDVIDILPVQLENLQRKLWHGAPVRTAVMDSTDLGFDDASFDQVLLFFLLHEQPPAMREQTMREALRVLKPGGTIVVADYAPPAKWHPVRFLILPFLRLLEPFASDFWRLELAQILPLQLDGRGWRKSTCFGGLYQLLVRGGSGG
ncbi:MAG: rhodoquinone biosynthesis methyltransferase RquA [Alphaproteobacteria bacterium]|nr:rhodoquinone biosynthesis methyltransferase RquA [Alphaproteobacteria bacterium]